LTVWLFDTAGTAFLLDNMKLPNEATIDMQDVMIGTTGDERPQLFTQ